LTRDGTRHLPPDDVRLAVVSNEETTDLIAIIRQAMATAFPRPE
jgi:hypothetical protein